MAGRVAGALRTAGGCHRAAELMGLQTRVCSSWVTGHWASGVGVETLRCSGSLAAPPHACASALQKPAISANPLIRWAHGEGPAASALVNAAMRSRSSSKTSSQSSSGLRQEFNDRRVLGWSQDKIFDMVADIDAYQNFLPWCSDSRVLSKVEDGCTAEIAVGFPPINERYISEVSLDSCQNSIVAVASNSEIFKELVNTWHFAPGPSTSGGPSTYVNISVVYEFRNPMHALLAAAAFDEVARQMIRAFEKRALALYGPPSGKV